MSFLECGEGKTSKYNQEEEVGERRVGLWMRKESEALGRTHEDQPEGRAVNDDFRDTGKGG